MFLKGHKKHESHGVVPSLVPGTYSNTFCRCLLDNATYQNIQGSMPCGFTKQGKNQRTTYAGTLLKDTGLNSDCR